MSVPTRGEIFSKLIECLRMAQEHTAMMAHLINAESPKVGSKDSAQAKGWLAFSEGLRLMEMKVIELAKGKLQ